MPIKETRVQMWEGFDRFKWRAINRPVSKSREIFDRMSDNRLLKINSALWS
jgi:hypothetical protein